MYSHLVSLLFRETEKYELDSSEAVIGRDRLLLIKRASQINLSFITLVTCRKNLCRSRFHEALRITKAGLSD